MSKTYKTIRALAAAGLVAMLMIAVVPAASAGGLGPVADIVGPGLPTAHCHKVEDGGSWSNDCTGVNGTCVGTWGSYGTYSTDENGKKTYTTLGTYEDVHCV